MSNIKFYAPVDFDDTSSGVTIDGDLIVDTDTLFVDVSADKVGIGTTSPAATLNVYNTASAPKAIFQHGTTDHLSILIGTSGGGIAVEDNNDFSIFHQDYANRAGETGLTTRLRINSSGDVGIGTSSPADKLTVNGNIGLFGNKIYNGSASNSAGIDFGDSQVDLHGYNGIRFFASTAGIGSMTERMRIVNNGNVLIGTTTDSGYKLNVNGTAYASEFDLPSGGQLDWANGDARIIEGDVSNYSLSFQTYTGSSLTTKMFISSGGNIGIGTTSPGAPLEIATTGTGDSLLITNTDATSSASPVITLNRNSASPADADYLGQIKFKGENDTSGSIVYAKITAKISDASAGTEDGLIETAIHSNSSNVIVSRQTGTDLKLINGVGLQVDGDVGIGTASPDQKLHVVGNTKVTGVFYTDYVQTLGGTSIDFRHQDASTIMRVDTANARVGIGTTSPSSLLQVQSGVGNTQLDGHQILLSRAGNNHIFATNASGVLALGTNNAEKMRITSGGNVLIGTTTDSGYKLDVSGSIHAQYAHVDEYIYHSGDTDTAIRFLDDSLQFNAGGVAMMKLTEGSADVVTINPDSADVNFQVNGDTVSNLLFVDAGTSKVGVGTNSPLAMLHAGDAVSDYGSQTFSTTAAVLSAVGVDNSATTMDPVLKLMKDGVSGVRYAGTAVFKLGKYATDSVNARTRLDIALGDGDGNTEGDNMPTVVTMQAGGNIGIGTTSPDQLLHVSGNTKTTNLYVASDIIHEGDTDTKIQFNTDIINFDTAGVERLRIAADGNVGIGTASPNFALDVSGDIRVEGANFLRFGGTGSSTEWGIQQTGTNLNFAEVGAADGRLYLKAGGNVGIGTTSPSYKLDVNGSFSATTLYGDGSNLTGITATETDTLDSVTGRGATTTNSITVGGLTVDTSTLHVDASNNRVGVGTTSPTQALDVNGTARAIKSEVDFTPTSDTIALDIRGTGTPNDFFSVSNATGGANDVFLPIFFYKAATYGYNGGTNRYPSGVYGGGFIAAVDDTSKPSSVGAGAAMHFNSRAYANNGALSSRYLFSWGSWISTYMAMTAGGNLLLGTTTDSGEKLQVNGDAKVSGDLEATGDFYQNGTQGWSGTINIPTNPAITITVQGGIITNVT